MLQEEIFQRLSERRHAGLFEHGPKQGLALFWRLRIEEGDMFFRTALALEIDGKKIRTAGKQEPNHFAAIFGVAHELRDLRENTIADAAIAGTGTVAELCIC